MMPDEPRPDATQPATPARERESLPMILLGVFFFAMAMVVPWLNAAQRPTRPPDTTTARMSTGIVLMGLYLRHYGPPPAQSSFTPARLRDTARTGAEQWLTASTAFERQAAQEPESRINAARTRLAAAALTGVASDLPRARQYLAEAATLDLARAAQYRRLTELYAEPPRAVDLGPSAAVLHDLSAAPLLRARAAEVAKDDAALRQALAPGRIFAERSAVIGIVILFLLLAVIIVFIAGLTARERLRDELAAVQAPAPPAPWDIGTALLVLSAVFFLSYGLSTTALLLWPTMPAMTQLIVNTMALPIAALLALSGFLRLLGHPGWNWSVFGWRRAALGVGFGVLGLLFIYPLFWLVAYLSARLIGAESHPLIPVLIGSESRWLAIYLVVVAVVTAPLVEETLFRGIVFRALNAHLPFWPAALVSAGLFAAGHAQLSALLPILLLGVLLAFLTRRTGSLLAPTAAHAFFNGVSAGIALLYAWLLNGIHG
jgi:membrane protease YdiL (CAAX protease family)